MLSGHFIERIDLCAAAALGPIAAAHTVSVVDERMAAAPAAAFVVEVVLVLLFLVMSAMALAEEVAGRAATAAAFFGDFVDDGTGSVIEHDWEAGHRLAGSPAEGTAEQATGRVDVPGEAHKGIVKQTVAAASLTAASQETPVLTARSFGSPLEKWEKDNPVSQIFVRDLMGKSVSLWVQSRITGDELTLAVSVATGVPLEFFYLTIEGHILGGQDLLGRFGALSGAHIRMNGRLRGGVRPPSEYILGQWTCGVRVEWRVVGQPGQSATGA